jgi:hypothetical protein
MRRIPLLAHYSEVHAMIAPCHGRLRGLRSMGRGLLLCGMLGSSSIAAPSCSTSHIETAWIEPSATAQSFALKRMLVLALVDDGAIRRATEDALVGVFRDGARGQSGELVAEPSYRLLTSRELVDVATARRKVEAAGHDGVVLIRFVSSQQRVSVDPPMYSGGFWGPHGYGRPGLYDAGRVYTDTILKLQINIYSLAEGRLLWSGVSSTLNPSKIDKLVLEVADAVRKELHERAVAP